MACRYGFAVLAIGLAAGLRWLFGFVEPGRAPYITFYLAVVATSLWAGRGPAILATLSGAAAATYLFIGPRFSFHLDGAGDFVWLLFYLIVCATVIAAIDSQVAAAKLARERLAEVEAEHELRSAAERMVDYERRWSSETLSSIGDGVITADAQGRVTYLNRVAEELTGWGLAEAVRKPIETVFHIVNEDTGQAIAGPIERVLREGVIVALANHTALVRKDGRSLPIDDSGAPIRTEDGKIVGAVLVFRDYTVRRRSEEANARLAGIVRFSGEAIISKSLDGTIQTWNPAAERLFGYTAEQAIGRPVTMLTPSGREHEESAIIESVRAGRVIDHFETVRRRRDGAEVHVSITSSPLYNPAGELIGISHIARDLTAEKELRAQLIEAQKLESLGVLAGGVAHDFNNLLTGIIGSGSLLAETLPEDSSESSLAGHILVAGERAAHLTRQLLAYAGKGRFVVEQIEPSATIREMADLVRSSIPYNTELGLELAENLPQVEVDVTQFRQMVTNLVLNGAEAMDGRPGRVTVATSSKRISAADIATRRELAGLMPGEYVSLEVRDTGSGMSPETLEKMFDPFFTTKFAGRGLGLAAVQGIVRGHHGAIRVESAHGRGTRFEVLLPPAERRDGPEPVVAPGQPTILVVDDQEVVRETARLTLQRADYVVLTAKNGQEAIEIFKRNRDAITLVLLDLTMPVLSGPAALEGIRAIRENVPVILFSGFNEDDALRQMQNADVSGFLHKPFTAGALKAKVRSVLGAAVRGQAGG